MFTAYEIGKCDDDTFIKALISTFNLELSPVEASKLWQEWVGETYTGTKEALMKLRKNYVTACLSNTNALHWAWLPKQIDIEKYFHHNYASHLINVAKPNKNSFLIPIKDMNVKPSDIWFFDDTLANIRAAQNIGISAFHVDRDVGVLPSLKELGVL